MDRHIGDKKTLNSFVKYKINRLKSKPPTMRTLFELMFSESENVIYEQSRGYKIIKTTYGESRENIEGKAATLKSMLGGVPADSVVGIYMNNGPDWIEAFWAVLLAGCRPLLMNLRLDAQTLEEALARMNAVLVISDSKTFESVKTVKADEIVGSDERPEAGETGGEIFVMSSGTSSSVKVCGYTAKQFIEQISDSYHILKKNPRIKKHYKGELKLLAFLPFYHIFGLVAVYIWFAFFSRTFVHLNDLNPDTIINTIRRHGVTHIFAVPLFWETVYKKAVATIKGRGEKTYKKFCKGLKLAKRLAGAPLLGKLFIRSAFKEVRENLFGDSISFMISGGSAIGPEVLEFFNGVGYTLANGYGMTEVGITSVELSLKFKHLTDGSVGKCLPSVRYEINSDGELLVKGRSVSAEIIEKDGVTVIGGGSFNTHDLFECRRGRYYILGRKDDLITAPSGENINPNLIEPKLSFGGVNGVCLIEGRRTPVLLVSVSKYVDYGRISALRGEINARLAELNLTAQIGAVAFVGEPLICGGEFKLNRKRLNKAYLDGTLGLIDINKDNSGERLDEIEKVIREMFATALNKDVSEVGTTSDFFTDEGGTSLDYFALLAAVRNEFNVTVPQEEGNMLTTVRSISVYVRSRL